MITEFCTPIASPLNLDLGCSGKGQIMESSSAQNEQLFDNFHAHFQVDFEEATGTK